MSGKVNRVSTQVLQRFLGTDATAWGNPVYVNLLTVIPTDDGSVSSSPTVTEWNAARVAVYNSLATAGAKVVGIGPHGLHQPLRITRIEKFSILEPLRLDHTPLSIRRTVVSIGGGG